MREEFEALDLPPFEERGAVTDEYIRAYKELWTSDDPHFDGKYVSFDKIHFLPQAGPKAPSAHLGGRREPPGAAAHRRTGRRLVPSGLQSHVPHGYAPATGGRAR